MGVPRLTCYRIDTVRTAFLLIKPITPLPLTCYRIDTVRTIFRLLQSAKHNNWGAFVTGWPRGRQKPSHESGTEAETETETEAENTTRNRDMGVGRCEVPGRLLHNMIETRHIACRSQGQAIGCRIPQTETGTQCHSRCAHAGESRQPSPDKQKGKQTGGRTDKQTDRQTERQTDRRTGPRGQVEPSPDKQTSRQTGGRTDKRTDRQTERQTDRQTENPGDTGPFLLECQQLRRRLSWESSRSSSSRLGVHGARNKDDKMKDLCITSRSRGTNGCISIQSSATPTDGKLMPSPA